MSGNAPKSQSSRKRAIRVLTWTSLAVMPFLAVLTLGSGLLPALTSDTPAIPGGLQVAETRALAQKGDDLASLNQVATADSLDEFMNNWQDTVRRRPSP